MKEIIVPYVKKERDMLKLVEDFPALLIIAESRFSEYR